MRLNHKWRKSAVLAYYRAALALGTLAMLALALGAGRKW